jgi:hypothetical protein
MLTAAPAGAEPRTHDGFQFRGAIGGGYLSDSISYDPGGDFGTIHGGAGVGEFYFGGTPVTGLVVGGFVSVTQAPGPSLSANGRNVGTASSDVSLNLAILAPYVDWFPNPNEGLHLLGFVGFGEAHVSDSNGNSSVSATGVALGAGIGYDWWISDEWSLGVLGRFTYAALSDTTSVPGIDPTTGNLIPGASSVTEKNGIISPAILFSFQYH